MVADLLVVNENFLEQMDAADQATFRKLAKESTATEFDLFAQALETAKQTATSQGATFTEVDITPFQALQAAARDPADHPRQKDIFTKIARQPTDACCCQGLPWWPLL